MLKWRCQWLLKDTPSSALSQEHLDGKEGRELLFFKVPIARSSSSKSFVLFFNTEFAFFYITSPCLLQYVSHRSRSLPMLWVKLVVWNSALCNSAHVLYGSRVSVSPSSGVPNTTHFNNKCELNGVSSPRGSVTIFWEASNTKQNSQLCEWLCLGLPGTSSLHDNLLGEFDTNHVTLWMVALVWWNRFGRAF